jgi:crossover junction endonuclease MUS81
MTHVVYLVEEYNPEKFHEFFSTAINTSLSQTIVTDGFEVQETRSIKFTIDYFYNLYWGVVEKYAVRVSYSFV